MLLLLLRPRHDDSCSLHCITGEWRASGALWHNTQHRHTAAEVITLTPPHYTHTPLPPPPLQFQATVNINLRPGSLPHLTPTRHTD